MDTGPLVETGEYKGVIIYAVGKDFIVFAAGVYYQFGTLKAATGFIDRMQTKGKGVKK